ncbi:hypothetical protein BDN72DRAFT_960915 [Pluteus cervinus]|uniref:Uncharacterized protein n=1 Tax=Pluteus cervinus TaxID=181527 RepID=A0ACD3APK1_9AGAR|nr:hypothetical protein BDN72DRAFT_960915 [Pluteus cervinus]
MSEGFQITIPDLTDDDCFSAPNPFSRSGGHGFGGFGGFGGGSGSGQESPTFTSPVQYDRSDKAYFSNHTRGDSVASEDSSHSVSYRPPTKQTTFGHSSQSSIANTNFTKKPSFASIRNVFKSGKNNDAPPVPHLEHSPYPVLRNPFNRSTSSLTQSHASSPTARGTPTNTMSPPYPRPPTPGSTPRGLPTRSKSHGYSKSHHSQSGSLYHVSDGGSDHGHGYPFSSSPPPVPRVPNAFGNLRHLNDTPPMSDMEEDKVVIDPKTPSDYALHAIFIRFATEAEGKIEAFLRQLDPESLLSDYLALGVDPKFDDILLSLGKIAQKHSKPVIDSVMRWRKSQTEPVSLEIIRLHSTQPVAPNRSTRPIDISTMLTERKSLASSYIMCRALIAVLQSISKDALGEVMGYTLEENTFEQFKKPDLKLLSQSTNHRLNAELFAKLVGQLATIRFVSVTDRFLNELGPVALDQVPKDSEGRYENLVKGLKHIQIKVWPSEAFEEGAEFLEALSKSYTRAHGFRLKTAFAEALVHLLHPISKTAQAETNMPQWGAAIEVIFPKAREMMSKPRYWQSAFPLAVISLCAAPQAYFLEHWYGFFAGLISKLKDKPFRIPVMNGIMRLIWTYLYRCQESASSTTTKLDNIVKYFFPPNRLTIFPPDDHLEPFIYITHFILSRHFDYGKDLCLDLMQASASPSSQQPSSVLAPERIAIAVQAILLSLSVMEREVSGPVWPSCSDFSSVPVWEDYPSSSDFLPQSILSKPSYTEFVDRCGSVLSAIAVHCGNSVGHMSILDDQWSYSRLTPAYEETHTFIVRRHPDGTTVAYPSALGSQIGLLQTCFRAWPRCLHSSIALNDSVDLLLQGVVHVEPLLGEVAALALKRFMADPTHANAVLARFYAFLFNPVRIAQEPPGVRLYVELVPLLSLWVSIVDSWLNSLLSKPPATILEDKATMARCYEIESAAMFLLSHDVKSIHQSGIRAMRTLGQVSQHLSVFETTPSADVKGPLYLVERLHGNGKDRSYLYGYDELLDQADIVRLEQWRLSKKSDIPLRIADSTQEKDRKLWRFVFPALMQWCMDYPGGSLSCFRETMVAAATRYHPTISQLAGLSSRPFATTGRGQANVERDGPRLVRENRPLIDQWHIWVKVLSSTATLSETSRPALTQLGREHSRAPSDANFERERLSTTRGLFRYLTPFLDSEYTIFRDAAVLCISSFPCTAYTQLLEDLSLLAGRQFYDDPRSKTPALFVEQNVGLLASRQNLDELRSKFGASPLIDRTRRQERLHSAVARIYYLTAHFLQQQRGHGRQAALASVLKFVRNTQAFLCAPNMRENHTLQQLRRYFCGTVERLFDRLATLEDSDRFIPSNMHLTLYRLCEEWCQLGPQPEKVQQRMHAMRQAAGGHQGEESFERFQYETNLLSNAAVGALASLCQKALFPPDQASSSPTERHPPEYLKALASLTVLERFSAILASEDLLIQARGKKGLKSLLLYQSDPQRVVDHQLIEDALRRTVVVEQDLANSSSSKFFEVITDIVCTAGSHPFTFSQIVCLGLSNLHHPIMSVRRHAFNILEAIHLQTTGLLAMSHFEATVGSLASGTYVHAYRVIADGLAGEHPSQAAQILAQIATWLPGLPPSNIILLLLQSLEYWIPHLDLMTEDKATFSGEGLISLYHLMSLTSRYGHTHTEQIFVIWSRLVDPPHQSNSHATVRFLLEQSHKVGSTTFISCAANVVACLCQTGIGRQVFEELCSVIEPARMLPFIEHRLTKPDVEDMELWDGLDALFADQPRLQLGSAQFAWLFLADVALQRYWELKAQLPVLLHALLTHLDHRVPYVRHRAQRMLFQLLRAWTPGYDELPDRSAYPTRFVFKEAINTFEEEAEKMYWKDDEPSAELEPKMKWFCTRIIYLLEPLSPSLTDRWGSLALSWGTACSIRATAFRSLQIFRALMPRVKQSDLALLLGRLSNTIAATDENIQYFTAEIILTINAVAIQQEIDQTLLPQMFWCACACLSTTVESEFLKITTLLTSLLDRMRLDDLETVELLVSHRPLDWRGSTSLQPALLKGLRSSITSDATLKLLYRLAKIKDDSLIDASVGRVRDLYTLSLPWCLRAMAPETLEDHLKGFAQDIGALAALEGRQSITRIMNSFARGAFRTRDDFLRQSVSSLREHYGAEHWTEIVTLLLSLVLNNDRSLQIHALQILKVLFQQRETRNPVERLGSELLMPLLRLLETDLAQNALDVLEEPMTMSGGPAAKHVLRMSMHLPGNGPDADLVTVVFGVPKESGWCVAQAEVLQRTCRANVMAVFDTCSIATRPSRIDFEPEIEALASLRSQMVEEEEDLGGLVKDLHDLSSFFQEDGASHTRTPQMGPDRRIEARVAAILAKSTAPDTIIPQTPFLDVFRIGHTPHTHAHHSHHINSDDSDDYSDPESEADAFIFDSPAIYRPSPNGSRYH